MSLWLRRLDSALLQPASASLIVSEGVPVSIQGRGHLFDIAPLDDEAETWVEVAREIQKRDIACVHLSDQLTIAAEGMPQGFSMSLGATYRGTLIAAGGFDRESAERALESGGTGFNRFRSTFHCKSRPS